MLNGDQRRTLPASRRRVRYLVLAVGTIAVGVMVHLGGTFLPPVFRDVLGDALWAMMIVWWMSVAAPRLPLREAWRRSPSASP